MKRPRTLPLRGWGPESPFRLDYPIGSSDGTLIQGSSRVLEILSAIPSPILMTKINRRRPGPWRAAGEDILIVAGEFSRILAIAAGTLLVIWILIGISVTILQAL